ncbi:MAG: hypothetical protein C1943_09095 [Halochromatium sp.]|nr:hypothetical protein [Halochromatium sp.]
MIEPPCELRIIRVSWARKDESTDVKTAQQPIRLEQGVDGWVAEVPAYPKVEGGVYGQLAVALPEGAAEPSLLLANDDSFPLTVVKAPDGREWWIEKGKWKKTKYAKYHDAPLCRHVGDARLRVGGEVIRLRIAPAGFTGEDFELLLDEFRNGAWQLILEPLSPTRSTDWRGDGGIDPAFLAAVSEFVRYVGRALDQPHRELREVRQLQRLERVRPHVGTFRELAVRGLPRLVSGRGHAPSFNTPENRRLLWMCIRLRRMLSGLLAGSKASTLELRRRAEGAEERAAYLQDSQGKVRVDQARLARLIEERENQLIAYQQTVSRLLSDRLSDTQLTFFDVPHPSPDADRGSAGFWFDGWSEDGSAVRFRLNFHVGLKTLKMVFDKRYCYRLVGNFDVVLSGISQSGRPWTIWRIARLTEILPMREQDPTLEKALRSEIDMLKGHRPSQGNTDFWKPLNKADADEQRRDLIEARASADRLRVASELWSRIASQLAPLAAQLSSLEARAQKMGIKEARQATVIGSMTWVMNPDYRGALGAYRNAQAKADLKASQLEGLLRLEDLGVTRSSSFFRLTNEGK